MKPISASGITFLFLLIGCGDGGTLGGGPGGGVVVDTLFGIADLSGIVQSDGSSSATSNPFVGDVDATDSNRTTRGLLSFDLTTIPPGRNVVTAFLRVYQSQVVGAPYGDLGNIVLDHVIYGNALDSVDFVDGTIDSEFATLSSSDSLGIKRANIFKQVKADLAAGRTESQFRLGFSLKDGNDNDLQDYAVFRDEEDFPPPIIIVTYN
jgi:hypothetical protein